MAQTLNNSVGLLSLCTSIGYFRCTIACFVAKIQRSLAYLYRPAFLLFNSIMKYLYISAVGSGGGGGGGALGGGLAPPIIF